LAEPTQNAPKTLLPFGHDTILSTILANLGDVGVEKFILVVGYQKDHIIRYLRQKENFGWDIAVVENEEWRKGNGISVLAAERRIDSSEFILSMSDHIVSYGALRRIMRDGRSTNLLLVDPWIERVHDIEDATKVVVEGTSIINIGKELQTYTAIDCGIFRLNETFFVSMREKLRRDQDSISAGVRGLIEKREIEAVFTHAEDSWIDIDTAAAYDWAKRACVDLTRGFSTYGLGTGLDEDRRR
jgi:choline kinase